jgi:hypothetical protein
MWNEVIQSQRLGGQRETMKRRQKILGPRFEIGAPEKKLNCRISSHEIPLNDFNFFFCNIAAHIYTHKTYQCHIQQQQCPPILSSLDM